MPISANAAGVLATQNPWQSVGTVPAEFAPRFRRPLAGALTHEVLEGSLRRYELILGPRRVGKTTVMYQVVASLLERGVPASRLWWMRLDHPILMTHSVGELVQALVERHRPTASDPLYLFLDELTYAQDWDRWLKTFYDERWPIRVIATASSAAALRQGRVESGIGRWRERLLGPWTFTEYLALRGMSTELDAADELHATLRRAIDQPAVGRGLHGERRRFLLVGGFPELLELAPGPDEMSELLRSQRVLRAEAVERAIYRDIPQAFGVQEPMKLERLLYTLAGQLGGLVSPRSLATAMGLSQPTIDKYLVYLQHAYLVFLLANYAPTEEAVQRRGRKIYFNDSAVRNAALQRGIAPLHNHEEMGVLIENLAAAQLHTLSQLQGARLFHWRHKRDEVDLVYADPRRPLAFELASSSSHGRHGLVALQDRYPSFRGGCYLVAPDVLPTAPNDDGTIGTIPLDLFLVTIGRQTEHATTL